MISELCHRDRYDTTLCQSSFLITVKYALKNIFPYDTILCRSSLFITVKHALKYIFSIEMISEFLPNTFVRYNSVSPSGLVSLV